MDMLLLSCEATKDIIKSIKLFFIFRHTNAEPVRLILESTCQDAVETEMIIKLMSFRMRYKTKERRSA